MGLINLAFDFCFVVLLVRALVRNEGHMAFNRPYQWTVKLLAPLEEKLRIPEKQVGFFCLIGLLLLAGVRGLLWAMFGGMMLDYKVMVIPIPQHAFVQCQILTLVSATVFPLQVYAFMTIAIVLGDLENRTDHYSRLMRALLGPLKTVPPASRCIIPVLGLIASWICASWLLIEFGLMPPYRLGFAGMLLGATILSFVLVVDLIRIWIALVIVRAVLSLAPFWRPPIVDVIERVTEPVLRPFRRFHVRVQQFDFTPVLAVVALALGHWAALFLLEHFYLPL